MRIIHFYSFDSVLADSLSWLLRSYHYPVTMHEDTDALKQTLLSNNADFGLIHFDHHFQVADWLMLDNQIILFNTGMFDFFDAPLPNNIKLIQNYNISEKILDVMKNYYVS